MLISSALSAPPIPNQTTRIGAGIRHGNKDVFCRNILVCNRKLLLIERRASYDTFQLYSIARSGRRKELPLEWPSAVSADSAAIGFHLKLGVGSLPSPSMLAFQMGILTSKTDTRARWPSPIHPRQLRAGDWVATLMTIQLTCPIAFGVIYNGTRFAVTERGRELASRRVIEFTKQEIATMRLGELGSSLVR